MLDAGFVVHCCVMRHIYTLNLVSHCNNETTHRLPDDTQLNTKVSQGFVHTEALVSEDGLTKAFCLNEALAHHDIMIMYFIIALSGIQWVNSLLKWLTKLSVLNVFHYAPIMNNKTCFKLNWS